MTTNAHVFELAPRSDGARYRRVALRLETSGDLVLIAHEMGASFKAAWGLDDEEVTVRIAARDLARLAQALIAERLAGGKDAVRALADLCEAHDIDHAPPGGPEADGAQRLRPAAWV